MTAEGGGGLTLALMLRARDLGQVEQGVEARARCALMLRARDLGLPLPAAMAPGTPWADLTG